MEIEIRSKIEDLNEIKTKLESLGATFEQETEQKDRIFKRKGTENEVQKPGSFILRLRKEEDKSKLTFKALTETTGVWEEHQVNIDNFEEAENIVLKSGFVESLALNKKRIKGKLGEFNLCLDKIDELGHWIEAEIISNNKEEGKNKLIELFSKIGITEIEHRGYVTMLFQKQGVKFKNTG